MNWQDIQVSADNSFFIYDGKQVFGKKFIEVLKFHSPGLAPVKDESGSYHIDSFGNELYRQRYVRTFGYYFNRAAVVCGDQWFHLTEKGICAYKATYQWVGNYQEGVCPVRDASNEYFHITLNGKEVYSQKFVYAGDYKDGIACVKLSTGFYKHIDAQGNFLNNKEFNDLGIFHKNFATAKDEIGWHHINKQGNPLYKERYSMIEPFYNGFAVVESFDNRKYIIDENGKKILGL